MTKKTLGYVHLEWTCPNCETRNPGPQKVCSSCGMPQPEDVEFEQPGQEKFVEDEAEIAKAKAGPDIHCYYCGSRNPADAETCSQCGAALTEGAARASGEILGAHHHGPAQKITCSACGMENEPDAAKCVQCGASLAQPKPEPPPPQPEAPPTKQSRANTLGIVIGVALLLLICAGCITFFVLSNRTEDTTGQIQACEWTREIAIEQLVPVSYEAWRDEIPAGANIGRCTEKVHHTESRPTGQTREVCGTPYTVDTGSGYGEVVQDCETEQIMEEVEIYAKSCEYTVNAWQVVDKATLSGSDPNPRWPELRPQLNQREGERDESYQFTFKTEAGTYTYRTGNANLFAQCQPGNRWILRVNTFNTVTDIEPAQ